MWLPLMLVSTFGFAISRVLQRDLLKGGNKDPITYSIYLQLLIALILLPAAILTGFTLPSLDGVWLSFILMVILYSFANIFVYAAIKETPISEVTIIAATMPVWTAMTSIPLLGETISPMKALGIFLAIFGVSFVFYQGGKLKLHKGHLFAIASTAFYGIALTNDAFLLQRFNPLVYSAVAFFLAAVFITMIYPKKVALIGQFAGKNSVLKFFTIAVLYGLATLLVFTSYKLGGEMSQISVIIQLTPIFTLAMGIFFLNEKENLPRKLIGGAIVVLGVLLVR